MMASKKTKVKKTKPLFRFEKEIDTICKQIEPRVNEVIVKFADGMYNEATMFAFWIGIGGDLDEALAKIQKRKNNRR